MTSATIGGRQSARAETTSWLTPAGSSTRSAPRTGSTWTGEFADVEEELADVVIASFTFADTLEMDLAAAIARKMEKIFSRGWREAVPVEGA